MREREVLRELVEAADELWCRVSGALESDASPALYEATRKAKALLDAPEPRGAWTGKVTAQCIRGQWVVGILAGAPDIVATLALCPTEADANAVADLLRAVAAKVRP